MRFIDNILEILWNLLGVLGKVASFLLSVAVKILAAFWDFLCGVRGLRRFTDRMNVFFRGTENAWNSSLAVVFREGISGFFLHLKNLIETSRRVRIWFFIMLFTVLFLWFHPPYKWGPWHYHESGKASYYGSGFYFNRTAGGERFLPFRYTAAHRTLPIGITVMVVNKDNHAKVYVRINDRGPFSGNRIMDLSKSAADEIGIAGNGTADVEIYTRKKYGK
ncbi:MAG: septal ring lytic transglycosylase RlpA family protein [Victivallales bacterium]